MRVAACRHPLVLRGNPAQVNRHLLEQAANVRVVVEEVGVRHGPDVVHLERRVQPHDVVARSENGVGPVRRPGVEQRRLAGVHTGSDLSDEVVVVARVLLHVGAPSLVGDVAVDDLGAAPVLVAAEQVCRAVAVDVELRGNRPIRQLTHGREPQPVGGGLVDHVALSASVVHLGPDRFDVPLRREAGGRLVVEEQFVVREPAVGPQVVLACSQRRVEVERAELVLGRIGDLVAQLLDERGVDLRLRVAAVPVGPCHPHSGVVAVVVAEDHHEGHDDQGDHGADEDGCASLLVSHFESPFSAAPITAVPARRGVLSPGR